MSMKIANVIARTFAEAIDVCSCVLSIGKQSNSSLCIKKCGSGLYIVPDEVILTLLFGVPD